MMEGRIFPLLKLYCNSAAFSVVQASVPQIATQNPPESEKCLVYEISDIMYRKGNHFDILKAEIKKVLHSIFLMEITDKQLHH